MVKINKKDKEKTDEEINTDEMLNNSADTDLNKIFKSLLVDDDKKFDDKILDFISYSFSDKDLEKKTEIPKNDFKKILKVALYMIEVKPYSKMTYNLCKKFLLKYFSMAISVNRQGRKELFDAVKSFKNDIGIMNQNENSNILSRKFLR